LYDYNNFGTLITQIIGHRKVASFPHIAHFVQLSYPGKLSNPKNWKLQ